MSSKGFTLIELMIVIAIIGILVATVGKSFKGSTPPVAGQEASAPLKNCI